ncbi:uncharacterized protein At2g29880-like [Gastrolobium bilobum]|uniref:uncharacterized protein At2g29880-like n=1 Tax=Gastrolobium bilobum TaxID=150636 RepID=UPI002AB11695|nr:uncharacterized protein At2g29880-like [Gastrolobium bilobum]
MGDSQQGNKKGKGKEKEKYEPWTMYYTNEFLHLLVDVIDNGLCDANGSLSNKMWDTVTKTFTASDEVWEDYLKSHPSHSKLCEKSAIGYEKLKIVFGGATATGNGSIALGTNDTDAITFGEENMKFRMENFVYDPLNDAFIASNKYESVTFGRPKHQ